MKILIAQYYKVNTGDNEYKIKRQIETDQCLLLNLQNPFLDEIHLLNEQIYDVSFIPDIYRSKVKQVNVEKRLTYKMVIDYYNANIPNTICILANADIFTDKSIEVLDHISFEQSVLALNRYEYDDDTTAALLNGEEINRHFTSLFPDYSASIWTQDAWIWKMPRFMIDNVDFCLGTTGCDNHFAYLLHNAGFRVYNPSRILSINHYDRLSSIVNDDGILKGAISRKRDPQRQIYRDNKIYLSNMDDCIDAYTLSTDIVSKPGAHPEMAKIKYIQNSKSISEVPFIGGDNAVRFSEPGYWSFTPETPYLEVCFDKVFRLAILDIQGKPCSRNDKAYGYISKFKLVYCGSNDVWKDYPNEFNGIPRPNGNFIKRNYLTTQVYCNKIRIYCLESSGVPALKVRVYGHSIQTSLNKELLLTSFNADWQRPVITEYNVFKQLTTMQLLPYHYFAFPWATLIDECWVKKTDLKTLLDQRNPDGKEYCTVVQHIFYKQLFPTFQALNIRYVFSPHCTLADREEARKFGITLFGFPLYAAVKRGMDESLIPMQSRQFLTSFIGQYDIKCYLTEIRLKIFDLFSPYADCLIKRRGEWHFQGMVYKGQSGTSLELEDEYKMALAHSKFSLCPSGSGPNSIRIWESMSYGSIPVILADTLVMPTIRTMPWTDAVIFWKESDIAGLYEYLKAITVEEMEAKSKACLTLFDEYFCDESFCRVMFEEMESIIQHT